MMVWLPRANPSWEKRGAMEWKAHGLWSADGYPITVEGRPAEHRPTPAQPLPTLFNPPLECSHWRLTHGYRAALPEPLSFQETTVETQLADLVTRVAGLRPGLANR